MNLLFERNNVVLTGLSFIKRQHKYCSVSPVLDSSVVCNFLNSEISCQERAFPYRSFCTNLTVLYVENYRYANYTVIYA